MLSKLDRCASPSPSPSPHPNPNPVIGPVLSKLVRRARLLVLDGASKEEVTASINYPDQWFPGLDKFRGVQVHLYRETDGPFTAITDQTLQAIKRRFPTGVQFTILDQGTPAPEALGVRSRPTWFINGHRFRGSQSADILGRYIQLEVQDNSR